MIIDYGTDEAFCVVSRTRQLFYYVRLAAPRMSVVEDGVRTGARYVDTVGPATSSLVQTTTACRVVKVFGNVRQTTVV